MWRSRLDQSRGIQHPGGGRWAAHHLLTWGEVSDAHARLVGLSGSFFCTPDADARSDLESDLSRHRAAAELRAAPGALCCTCWAQSCCECGEDVDLDDPAAVGATSVSELRPWCRACAGPLAAQQEA